MIICASSPAGTLASTTSKNWRNSEERWRRCSRPITRLVFHSRAPNSEVVPWALVVVAAPLRLTGPQGQQRLGAVQRLNLALLVHAEDQSVIRRVHIQAHDIAHFLEEQRVRREFEVLGAMRLQTKGAPN